MPGFFRAVHTLGAAPFTPYNWTTWDVDMRWRLDFSNTTCYPGSGATAYNLKTPAETFPITGGPSFNTSGSAKYLNFDGVNDGMYHNVPTSYNLVNGYYWVWGFWLRQATAAANSILTISGIDDDAFVDLIKFQIRVNSQGNSYGVAICMNDATTPRAYPTTITPGAWTFICFEQNFIDVVFRTFVNGSLVNTFTPPVTVNIASEYYTVGGSNFTGTQVSGEWWKGDMAEAFVWRKGGGTAAERESMISAIYNGTKGRYGL